MSLVQEFYRPSALHQYIIAVVWEILWQRFSVMPIQPRRVSGLQRCAGDPPTHIRQRRVHPVPIKWLVTYKLACSGLGHS